MSHAAGHEAASPVLFEERPTASGHRIGIATLNAPRTLNGFSLAMAHLLDDRLRRWADDPAIVAVILQGAGENAFCAGGDLHGLYRGMVEYRQAGKTDIRDNAYAAEFFEVEYRLDYRIHTCAKPILCWGHGIVMGGGIGLMSGASHRVVSERSRLAFPEITVGLFPDVGGSWLLAHVPDHAGLFLALTGARLDPGDAIHAHLADHLLPEAAREAVYAAMRQAQWHGQPPADHTTLSVLLQAHELKPEPGPLQRHRDAIAAACGQDRLDEVVAAIAALPADDPWIAAAQATLAAGAPGSARLGFELQHRAAALTLADTFRMEMVASLHCAAHGDFAEGIRALLIDKDRNPHWHPATLAEATPDWAEGFLASPWPAGTHPLADLGAPTSAP